MRSLRGAQQGYRYQDIVAEKIVCWALAFYINPTFIVDEKESPDDSIEDLKVIVGLKKDCFQIKHSNNRQLAIKDFKATGELSLKKLLNYDESQKGFTNRYFFLLKWKTPTDELKGLFIEDELKIFEYKGTKYFKFNPSAFHDICLKLDLEANSQSASLLSKIHVLCDMPESSRDFSSPLELEDDLINTISNLGIGRFPNESTTPEQFAINLFNELNFYRSDKVFTITAKELLKKLCVCVDFGKLNETPSVNESILISDEEGINRVFELVDKNERTLIVGEPGSGKTYFCYSFEEFLCRKKTSYTKHYFYVNTLDADLTKRSRGDYLVGNLLSAIYERYPETKSGGSLFGASIDDLNLALESIDERLVILVDGVDHAFRNYLPNQDDGLIDTINRIVTNDYIHILLISQPSPHLDGLANFAKLAMERWTSKNIKALAKKKGVALSDSDESIIENKGQGNPLYINYLLDNIADIANVPVYNGDIKDYYSYLTKNSDSPHLFQYFVAIPFSFTERDFSSISNSGNAGELFIRKNLFLLKYNNLTLGYKVYHESLIRFLFDYCEKNNIDLKQTKRNVIDYLKRQPFYSDFKSYNYTNQLCFEVGDLDSILGYVSYDFLINSLYNGRCLAEINNNLHYFKEAICQKESFELYTNYLLIKKCLDVYFDEEYAVDQTPDYFMAYLSIAGEAGIESLLLHDHSPKNANLIYYSAAMDGIVPPVSFLKEQADYSSFERDYSISNAVISRYLEGKAINGVKREIPFSQKLEIFRTIRELGKTGDFSNTNDEDLKSIMNTFSFEPVFKDASNRIKMNFERSFFKEDFAKILCDFVSGANCGFVNQNQELLVSELQEGEFIFAVFRLALDNHAAYETFKKFANQKLFNKTLLSNIVQFKKRVEPFKGKPRACDFTSVEFKYVFVNLLLLPLKYLTELQGEYFKEVLEIKDKLETSFRGSVMSCISLDEIMENIKVFLDGDNMEVILKAIEHNVADTLRYRHYAYSAGFCFKLSRLYKDFSKIKQKDYYKKGIGYSLCYGSHKDVFFEEIIDAFDAVESFLDEPVKDLIDIGDMANGLDYHTDGRETKWFFIDWIRMASQKNVAGCSSYICDRRLNCNYFWKIDIGTGKVLERIYDKVSTKLLFYLLVSNQFEESHFDYNIYYYCLKQLVNEKEIGLVHQLLNYLVSLKEEFVRDSSFVNKLNSIIGTEKLDFQPFSAETNQAIEKEQERQRISPTSPLDSITSLENFSLSDVAEVIFDKKPLSDNNKEVIEKLFYNYRWHSDLKELCDLILAKEWNGHDKAYLYAISYFYCRDGWDKAFIRPDFFEKGLKQDKKLFRKYFFDAVKRNQDVWRGVGGMCGALSLDLETRACSIEAWKSIKDFTTKRLPDCCHEIDVFQFEEDVLTENIGLDLLLSGLNDYGLDNHKTILRFVEEEIQRNNEMVINWIFNRWGNLKLFTKLDLLTILLRNDFDFNGNSELLDRCLRSDDSVLSKVILSSVVSGKKAKAIPPVRVFVGSEEQLFCYKSLYSFRHIYDFCAHRGIDSELFLTLFKEKSQNKKASDEYQLFYSPASLRPIDNYYRYNVFLEASEEFFNTFAGKIEEDDLFDIAFALLPFGENICTNIFGPFVDDSSFVTLASYDAKEIQGEFAGESNLKVKKHLSIKQLGNEGHHLLLNNIDSICSNDFLYDHQIEFVLPFEMMEKYNIECKEISGARSYFVDGKMVALFQTIKSSFDGVGDYCHRYYLNEEGRFYIQKEFLNRICIDYGYSESEYESDMRTIEYFG